MNQSESMSMNKSMNQSEKIGIFGGSFNPPHVGHVNVVQQIQKKLGLKKIYIIPTAQNPLKTKIEGATPEQRSDMVKAALSSYGEPFIVDDQEIQRGGKSYAIETILNYRKNHSPEDIHLIMGNDVFDGLGLWKNVDQILKECNLIIVTRPGGTLIPDSIEDLPECIRPLVKELEFNFIELQSGRNIQFIEISEIKVSGTELRKKIRSGRNIEKLVPLAVENYIRTHHLYQSLAKKIGDYEKFTLFCLNFFHQKKSIMAKAYDLRQMNAPSEFSLVTSGTSTRHASSLAENLVLAVKEEFGLYPQSLEGIDEGRWVLIDYGNLIIHIFYDFIRQEYRLEDLWKNAQEINLPKMNPNTI